MPLFQTEVISNDGDIFPAYQSCFMRFESEHKRAKIIYIIAKITGYVIQGSWVQG